MDGWMGGWKVGWVCPRMGHADEQGCHSKKQRRLILCFMQIGTQRVYVAQSQKDVSRF